MCGGVSTRAGDASHVSPTNLPGTASDMQTPPDMQPSGADGPTPDEPARDPRREPTPEDDPRREEVIRDPDAPGRGVTDTDSPIPEPNKPA